MKHNIRHKPGTNAGLAFLCRYTIYITQNWQTAAVLMGNQACNLKKVVQRLLIFDEITPKLSMKKEF